MALEVLRLGARALGLSLTSQHLDAFRVYLKELEEWNQKFNLTAITGSDEIQRKHFLDAMSCLLVIPEVGPSTGDTVPLRRSARRLWFCDIGSGAGFPGLVLKIMLPEIKMTLIEATRKKCDFLAHVTERIGLRDVEILHARAEDLGQRPEYRGQYDVALSRAVAPLCVLAEYCLPLLRLGGVMVAQKGPDASTEVAEAREAFATLGGEVTAIRPVHLPDVAGDRYLIVAEKNAPTPAKYPRRPGMPSKRPL
ncbi:MAG: 16S rRNA (guanine(527)-N(7))-methyltransferase RsmG [Anaerolineae bacterium]